jgi:hypothetical protein
LGGIRPEERLDGQSLLPLLTGGSTVPDRDLLFECGWHVGANFACAVQKRFPGGEHYLFTYNCASPYDELHDLNSADAVNIVNEPGKSKVRAEMVTKLGRIIEGDARFSCYRNMFRLDHYFDLPRQSGDLQMKKS